MEEEKLIRRKKKALNGSNRHALAKAYNDLASFYYKHKRYGDALAEFKSEAAISNELGLRMEWGTCNRMIGEMYMLLAEFDQALKYQKRHLAVAKELKNLVEEQRAISTLGRIYLLQGQSTTDDDEAKTSLRAAEIALMKSHVLCENLNGKINKHELMDMRARLLLNIGVVQDHLGNSDKALDNINKAISICSSQDLYEVLHNCYTTEALLHCNRKKDYAKALSCLNKALEVAERLEDKVLKTCETLSSKADILCKMSDYQSAKQVLLKAWKLKTPDEKESANIEANLRVVAAMCYTKDLLISADPSDHLTFKKLYEKLGDGACHLRNYAGAVEYYLKMLRHAELAGECGQAFIPIYVSLYQTYKDMGAYNEALDYFEKEYELIKEVPKEAFTTMYNIAETLFLAKRPYVQIEKACLEARRAAQKWNKRKYEIRVLKSLLKYQEKYGETDKMEQTKDDLRELGDDNLDNLENSEDQQSSAGGGDEDTHIGDDICLEDLTDLSDTNEERVKETKHETCKPGKGYTIKKNMKGETQLHIASISGNRLLVERLIARGHPVNIRDNAGWLPLHEACMHGHVDVANILINNGAYVNDRGGSNCDGTTPLYDAASNGHLNVVQLLLEKGAIPTLETDFGETPLHVLQKWRASTMLTKQEETMYNNICSKIQNSDKSTTIDVLNRSKSKTLLKPTKDISPPSTSKITSRIKELDTPVFNRRNIIDDDSDVDVDLSQITRNAAASPIDDTNSSDDCKASKDMKTSTGVKKYRNAIEALKNRSIHSGHSDLADVDVKKSKVKPALLNPEEVDDDWLDADLGINNNNKKRKLSDPLTTVAKTLSYESIKDKIEEINQISEPLIESNKYNVKKKSRVSKIIDVSENNSHSDSFQRNEIVSAAETMRNIKRLTPTGTFSRKSSGENVHYNSNVAHNDSFNIMQSMNPNIAQAMNVIQPINILQSSKNGRPVQTQILPPTAVKVQVEDKVLLISLKLDMINKLTISWLVEEVKSRYYKLTGVRPVFSLMTSDGAILSEDDPLNLALSSPELKTCITNWKASPAEERYLECCDALSTRTNRKLDDDGNDDFEFDVGMTSRKRVSVRQLELLVEYLEGHRDLARGRLSSKEGSALTSRLWSECANILNAEADGDQSTPKEWSKWYTDYKCRLLNRLKQIRDNQRGTGGGPGLPTSLSPLDERLAALLDAGTEAVGRSATPQNEVQINPLSPAPHAVSPLPAVPNSLPALPDSALPTIFALGHPPTPNNSNNIYEDTTQDITYFTESEQEATAARQRRSNNPRRRRRRSPPSSELDQTQNRLANLEKSRIEVERLVAEGYNKMADAINRIADAANKSADAQCRIAEALTNMNSSSVLRHH